MRRKDREVTQQERILEIIARCDCCRLGFADGEEVYIVPLNFGFLQDEAGLHLYFHGAGEGRKADLIRTLGRAAFEMDTGHQVKEHEQACGHSFLYQSVMGQGRIVQVEDQEEKIAGLRCVMAHYSPKSGWEFPPQALEKTGVFRLDVTQLSCKEHL